MSVYSPGACLVHLELALYICLRPALLLKSETFMSVYSPGACLVDLMVALYFWNQPAAGLLVLHCTFTAGLQPAFSLHGIHAVCLSARPGLVLCI